MEAGLRVNRGGSGEPVLLLLHGLGATGDVWQGWRPLLARRWPGRWLAPDLPGHGGSPPLPGYTFESLAAAVAGAVGTDARTVVLGHSLGGVVGLALAGGGRSRSRDEAAARYLRISGLADLLDAAGPAVDAACVSRTVGGGWPWIQPRSPSGHPICRNCWHDPGPW